MFMSGKISDTSNNILNLGLHVTPILQMWDMTQVCPGDIFLHLRACE